MGGRAVTVGVLSTRLCELVGVERPVVQTGMGWVSGPRLTAATAAAGGLGILASATMTLDQLGGAIADVKGRTDRPFGVNMRADQPDVPERIDLLVREGVAVASFATPPRADVVARLKDAGIVVIPTIGAPRHAEKMAALGVDAVIAQGREGGGHTGEIPTSLLVPGCVDVVDIPVIAAGGFRDGRGLVAALALGAEGIAMGTRFLLTKESTVPQQVKEQYLAARLTDTVRTSAVDGHPQRVLRTELVDELEKASPLTRFPRAARNALRFRALSNTSMADLVREGLAMRSAQGLSLSQVAMAGNAPMMTRATLVDGDLSAGVLPTGQVVGEIDELISVADLLEEIMAEAETTLDRLGG